MANTFTLSVTVSSTSDMGKAIAALAKLGLVATVTKGTPATDAVAKAAEPTPRVYDKAIGTLEERELVSLYLDTFRGKGMIAAVRDSLGIGYAEVSALVSAEGIARRKGLPLMADAKSEPNVRKALGAILKACKA